MRVASHELRCIGCGDRISGEATPASFRCAQCASLFEVVYPWSEQPARGPGSTERSGSTARAAGPLPNSSALRWLWQERRTSTLPADQSGVWRFRDLLPILERPEQPVTLREGNTPLYELPRSAKSLGLHWLLAKHQGLNPTASFKDTGMTAALSVAAERGFRVVACASTGNTSASMAAYAARAGMQALVLIPEGKIAWGKLSQAMDYGAMTLQLRTDFDGCVRVLSELIERLPVYLLNSVNPYRLEGQKTPAFELMEQMDWQVPDHILVPGGNLANGAALGKGFQELQRLGLIGREPRISVIQAEGANPLFRSLAENGGKDVVPVTADTRASAIRIGNPASFHKAVHTLERTGGWCEQVSEVEIAMAKAEIGAEGLGCEPASAATLAGLKKLVRAGRVTSEQRVVLLLTGHTLKDPEYTIELHAGTLLSAEELGRVAQEDQRLLTSMRRAPMTVEADPSAVLRLVERELQQPVLA